MSVLTVIGYVLAILGAGVLVAAGVGLRRFTDPYMRISAVGTAAGVGMALVTIGAVLTMPTAENVVKAAIAVALQLLTSGVASTLMGRAAVMSGHAFTPGTDTTALDAGGVPEDGAGSMDDHAPNDES